MSSYTDIFGNTVKYHYDIENNLKKIEYPGDKATKIFAEYSYDNAGQLTSVKDWKDNVTKYSYDKVGNLAQITRPDESVESYIYDEAGNLKNTYNNKKSGDCITSYTYKYSENGDLSEEVSNHDNTVYTIKYDTLGRIMCRTRSNKDVLFKNRFDLFSMMSKNDGYISSGFLTRFWASDSGTTTKEIFGYDASGNIQAINEIMNKDGQYKETSLSKQFIYGNNNQLLSYTENNGKTLLNPFLSFHLGIIPFYCPNMLMYDDDGNVISIAKDKKIVSIGYDINNRLTLYGQTKYTYDAEGNRIKKETGEPHLFSRTLAQQDGTYMCTPPDIMILTKAYKNILAPQYPQDKFEIKEIVNGVDKKEIENFLGSAFYLNGASGISVISEQTSISAEMLVPKPDFSNVNEISIPVMNPDLERWLLLIAQLGLPDTGDEELIYKLYFNFMQRELIKAKFLVPMKHNGEIPPADENGKTVLKEGMSITFSTIDGKYGRPAIQMYTDWKRLRAAMGEGWKGFIQTIDGIIDIYDCAINLTEYDKSGCYISKEMYESMKNI